MFFESNSVKFKRANGPFVIEKGVYEVSNCFMYHGTSFPGGIGLMAKQCAKNEENFIRQADFYGGGMLVFPQVFQLGTRDLSFIENYHVQYAWNRSFIGQFIYNDQTYSSGSLTLDISNMSMDRMLEISKDIARKHFNTDVILKIFPTGRIFVVLNKF